MLLHRERGLGCTLRLSVEIQPLGCCFDGCVLRLRLLVASVPGSPAGGHVGAFPDARSGRRCSSTSGAEIEFWCPGILCWSPVHSTLRQLVNLSVFRGFGSGFLPPTSGRSFIGGTSAWSGPLLRVTAVSGLWASDCSLPLRRWILARVWFVTCLPLLREWRTATF